MFFAYPAIVAAAMSNIMEIERDDFLRKVRAIEALEAKHRQLKKQPIAAPIQAHATTSPHQPKPAAFDWKKDADKAYKP